ncbi:ABC transporter substrate-binding protein [Brevibacterium sp. 50QC2O2]|uniref:ABC transporter substrate-binding protein n=1 Tax=Brevibacterium sp. 50QC2O2 TaxID=2968459 RepID=UPI00211BAD91|nr:ABC transporter substrate-binding protein [Brevibacterium sp. 50QC2O2]MCQ9388466.1 ABC transporter substrate-binding protein [Brevibacterium sp. 50QC2O2]
MKRLIAAVCVSASLLLTGCMGGGLGDSKGSGPNDFTFAFNAQPTTLDPMMATATATRDISRNFLEPLIAATDDGQVKPVLASKFSMSKDNRAMNFTLRHGVKFHNGDTMDVDDAVASVQAWLNKTGSGKQFFAKATVEKTGDDTLRLNLPEPLAVAPTLFADMLQGPVIQPKEVMEAAGDSAVTDYTGTGPYKFEEWQTDQFVRLSKFDDYVSPAGEAKDATGHKEAHFDNIFYYFVTDQSTRMSGLQTGEYDAANVLPPDNFGMLDGNKDLAVEVTELGFNAAVFNKKTGPMANPKMRQAVLAAANTEDIQKAAFSDRKFYDTDGALAPPYSPWNSKKYLERYNEKNPGDVKRLLDEAGYKGEPIRILTSREYEDHYNNAVVLNQQLINAGIKSQLVVTDWATVLQDRTDPKAYEIFITGSNSPTNPLTAVYLNKAWPGWTDSKALDTVSDKILTASSEKDALTHKDELQKAFYDYLPIVKFGKKSGIIAFNKEFTGYRFSAVSGDLIYNMQRK